MLFDANVWLYIYGSNGDIYLPGLTQIGRYNLNVGAIRESPLPDMAVMRKSCLRYLSEFGPTTQATPPHSLARGQRLGGSGLVRRSSLLGKSPKPYLASARRVRSPTEFLLFLSEVHRFCLILPIYIVREPQLSFRR